MIFIRISTFTLFLTVYRAFFTLDHTRSLTFLCVSVRFTGLLLLILVLNSSKTDKFRTNVISIAFVEFSGFLQILFDLLWGEECYGIGISRLLWQDFNVIEVLRAVHICYECPVTHLTFVWIAACSSQMVDSHFWFVDYEQLP